MENPVRRLLHYIHSISFGVHLSLGTFLLLKKKNGPCGLLVKLYTTSKQPKLISNLVKSRVVKLDVSTNRPSPNTNIKSLLG